MYGYFHEKCEIMFIGKQIVPLRMCYADESRRRLLGTCSVDVIVVVQSRVCHGLFTHK